MVYVDDYRAPFRNRTLMSHMMADTENELDAMAELLGLKMSWKQPGNMRFPPHYDICESKRKLAVSLGAKEVGTKELVTMMARKTRGKLAERLSGVETKELVMMIMRKI